MYSQDMRIWEVQCGMEREGDSSTFRDQPSNEQISPITGFFSIIRGWCSSSSIETKDCQSDPGYEYIGWLCTSDDASSKQTTT